MKVITQTSRYSSVAYPSPRKPVVKKNEGLFSRMASCFCCCFKPQEMKTPLINKKEAFRQSVPVRQESKKPNWQLQQGQVFEYEKIRLKLGSHKEFKPRDKVLVNIQEQRLQVAEVKSVNGNLCILDIGKGCLLYKSIQDVFHLKVEFEYKKLPPSLEVVLGQHLTEEEVKKFTDIHRKHTTVRVFAPNEAIVVYRSARNGKPEYYQYAQVECQFRNGNVQFKCGEANVIIKPDDCIYKLRVSCSFRAPLTEPKVEYAADEDVTLELEAEDKRTLLMRDFLSYYSGYNDAENTLSFGGRTYTPLTGNTLDISTKRTASCGSSSEREVVLMDPERSPLLSGHCEALRKELLALESDIERNLNEAEVLGFTAEYVRRIMFPLSCSLDSVSRFETHIEENKSKFPTIDFRDSQGKKVKIPVVTIDYCIALQNGVCRHHAMVLAHLLDYLVKDKVFSKSFSGIAQQMRDNIGEEGHVWVTFMGQSGKRWMIDSYYGHQARVVDFSNPENHAWIVKHYTEAVLVAQIRRTERSFALVTGACVPSSFQPESRRIIQAEDAVSKQMQSESDAEVYLWTQNTEGLFVLLKNPQDEVFHVHYYQKRVIHKLLFVVNQDGSIECTHPKKRSYSSFGELCQVKGFTQYAK